MKHIKHTKSRVGDLSEYYAITWLWDQGYEVFPNAGSQGMVDIVAWHPATQEVILIDVKTSRKTRRNKDDQLCTSVSLSASRTAEQIKKGVRILAYNADTRKLKFVEHKHEQSD